MLLATDIGNTNIEIGVFKQKKLIRHWRIKTEREKTKDEYSILLLNLLRMEGLAPKDVSGLIISSVVPPLTPVFVSLYQAFLANKVLVVGPGLKTGMPILYENPQEVGADRIVASVAAFEKLAGPVIICDFGTAATFDVVSKKGEYLGGAIAPGIKISAEALYLRTAKLPHVEIRKPEQVIGRTTECSIQSGLYYGYIGLISHMISAIKKELAADAHVVATGGVGKRMVQDVELIDSYEPYLILEGLRILHERNI